MKKPVSQLLPVLLWIAGVAPIVGAIDTPRFYSGEYADFIMSTNAAEGPATMLLRLLLVAAAGCAVAMLVRAPLPAQQSLIRAAPALALSGAVLLSTLVNGDTPSGAFLIGPLMFWAMAAEGASPTSLSPTARRVLLVHVYGSLVAALAVPEWALQADYDGAVLPFVSFRLHGISNHANNLALLAMLFLVFDVVAQPNGRPSWRVINRLHAAAVVVLTQSKTIWIAGGVVGFVIAIRWATSTKSLDPLLVAARRATRLSAIGSIAAVIGVILVSLQAQFGETVWTLTGRTTLWEITLSLWRSSPFVGLGEKFWAHEMRSQFLVSDGVIATHAHNELFQTLGQTGAIGVICLLAYLYCGILAIRRSSEPHRTAIVLTATLLLVRMATEPVLSSSFGTPNFTAHLFAFGLIFCPGVAVSEGYARLGGRMRPRPQPKAVCVLE